MKMLPALIFLLCLGAFPVTSAGDCLDERLTGINMAGAEFGGKKIPGKVFKDYTYPKTSELEFIAAQGANIIRLPFRWERIQHQVFEELNSAELSRLKSTVESAHALGLCVLLDIHNYGKYYGTPIVGETIEADALADLWLRLATQFNDPQAAIFGLMNEPSNLTIEQWSNLAKRVVARLRQAGHRNRIFVAGGRWSGMHDWFKERSGLSNAEALATIEDPINRITVEMHQYVNKYYSGTTPDCYEPSHFAAMFERVENWARDNKQQLFLGEFGVVPSKDCLATLRFFLQEMEDSPWTGWTYWAGGGWWGDYPFALNTDPDNPSPQWQLLQRYFALNTRETQP
ncbi:MAG: glycoside hydrolase family 5 protein [Pseudomonadota bacterium]|nr:glycoside hydrolase family 5 protein [Pseudomonadota bacterium]